MSEYSCAVTLASLDNWDVTRNDYLNIALQAKQICADINLNVHQAMDEGFATPYWVIVSEHKRQIEEIKKAFESSGFETKKWWQEGCHRMPAYFSFTKESLTNTDLISERNLGLPFHLFLPDKYWYLAKNILSGIKF
jgi:dTDP-4-amino-4,6-dideoxygalactose transaminase